METNIDYKDQYIRALADYKNLQRRTKEERENAVKYMLGKLSMDFFEIIDDLQNGAKTGDEVMNNLYHKAIIALARNNIYVYGEAGEDFDSTKHSAIMLTEDYGYPDNAIVEVQRNGYKFEDTILRYPNVIVNKLKK